MVNIDFSILLRIRQSRVLRKLSPILLDAERRSKLDSIGNANVKIQDLRRGIPYPDDSVCAVYHSHVLEHIDRTDAPAFLREALRVLRPGGVQRIVVPDLHGLVQKYETSFRRLDTDSSLTALADHDERIADMIEQLVRREAAGTATKPKIRRRVENILLGDARRRGETHQWMYDRGNMRGLLERVGFVDVSFPSYATSSIEGWGEYALDLDDAGLEYKPGSLYAEARKPTL